MRNIYVDVSALTTQSSKPTSRRSALHKHLAPRQTFSWPDQVCASSCRDARRKPSSSMPAWWADGRVSDGRSSSSLPIKARQTLSSPEGCSQQVQNRFTTARQGSIVGDVLDGGEICRLWDSQNPVKVGSLFWLSLLASLLALPSPLLLSCLFTKIP